MQGLRIRGGRPLSGSIQVHGAKNSVLPILAAAILSGDTCVIEQCPRLEDVEASGEILRHLGCRTHWEENKTYPEHKKASMAPVMDAFFIANTLN